MARMTRPAALAIYKPPLPREHGAWVMLYAPLLIGLFGFTPMPPGPAALLIAAVTGAFLAQNAAAALIRPRPKAPPGTWLWFGLFATAFAAAGLGLLVGFGLSAYMVLGAAVAALFGVHAYLLKGPPALRLDRFQWGQLLAVGGLALTAPAAAIAATGRLDAAAWGVWAACVAFFGSGVFNVHMLLATIKRKGDIDAAFRWAVGKQTVLYHALLAGGLAIAMTRLPLAGAALVATAFLPIFARAAWTYASLSRKATSFRAVGFREAGLAGWFTVCLVAALHLM